MDVANLWHEDGFILSLYKVAVDSYYLNPAMAVRC